MGLTSALAIAAFALGQTAAPPKPSELLVEVQVIVGQLTTKTERTVALLALAQAQTKLGRQAEADETLRLGWAAYQTGADRWRSAGDADDLETLFETGEVAKLPAYYAYAFVAAGDIPEARRAALELEDSPLGDLVRQELADLLRASYPQSVDQVTLTDEKFKCREDRKQELLASVPLARAKGGGLERVEAFTRIAVGLTTVGEQSEAVSLFREAATLTDQITNLKWRSITQSKLAGFFWDVGDKPDAKDMFVAAQKTSSQITDKDQMADARLMIEQTRRTLVGEFVAGPLARASRGDGYGWPIDPDAESLPRAGGPAVLKDVPSIDRRTSVIFVSSDPARLVVHDRRSPQLRVRADALARTGHYGEAVELARSIPSPVHRAIALAEIARNSNP